MREMKTGRYLAIAQLAGALLVIAIAIVGGLVMQIELAAPGPKWSMQFYNRMLTFHDLGVVAVGAAPFAGVLGYLAIGKLVGATRIPAPALGWVAFGVWVLGVVVSVIVALISSSDTGWTMYTPATLAEPKTPVLLYIAPLLLAMAATLYAVHLAIVVVKHHEDVVGALIAGTLVLAIGGAGVMGMRTAFESVQPVYASSFTVAAAMMLATLSIAGNSRVLVMIGCGLALMFALAPLVLIALALAGIWIALAIMGGFGRPAVAFVVFGCAPALVGHAFGSGFMAVGETFLHDTHFAIGTLHLMFAAIGFAAMAGLCTWFPRAPHAVVAWIGGVVCSAGFALHVYSSLIVGSRGMPRRYWDYDPMYTSGFSTSLIGSIVLLVGAVIVAVSFVISTREDSR